MLRACAGSGLCEVLGQHVAQPAGRPIVLALPFLGGPTSRSYMSTVARSASRLATSRLIVWRTCSTPRSGSTSLRRSAHSSPARSAVEREFGRLKNEWALAPLRVRGLERVQLHADLTILAKLACALARARAVPLAA